MKNKVVCPCCGYPHEIAGKIKEARRNTYNKRINESFITNCGGKSYTHFDTAGTERGILKARSLLLIRKLQAWRKAGRWSNG